MEKLRERIKDIENVLFDLLKEDKIKTYSVEIYGYHYTGYPHDGHCTIWVHRHDEPNRSFDFYPDEDFAGTLQNLMEYINR